MQRKTVACLRCRQRKVKCDNGQPRCSNCAKADIDCEDISDSNRRYIRHLESRIQWLEDLNRQSISNTNSQHVEAASSLNQLASAARVDQNVPHSQQISQHTGPQRSGSRTSFEFRPSVEPRASQCQDLHDTGHETVAPAHDATHGICNWSTGSDEGHFSQMPRYPGISRGGATHLPSTVMQSGFNNPTTTTSNTLGHISESGSPDCSYQQHTQLSPNVQGNAHLATIQASANPAATLSRNADDAIRLPFTSTSISAVPTIETDGHIANAGAQSRDQSEARHVVTLTLDSEIGSEKPLAHDVGLLSLSNSASDPKYIGPSSGITFAQLVFATAPQTQGLPVGQSLPVSSLQASGPATESSLTSSTQLSDRQVHRFVFAFLDSFHTTYPFLLEDDIHSLLDSIPESANAFDLDPSITSNMEGTLSRSNVIVLSLVIALGASSLESKLNTSFGASTMFARAMDRVASAPQGTSLKGIQIMILLALSGLCFRDAPNAWFLSSTIISSCIDLGLQRKISSKPRVDGANSHMSLAYLHDIRSAIFWTAYSLDRSLATILGRPLTLRDEAIDVEFPGERNSFELDLGSIEACHHVTNQSVEGGHSHTRSVNSPKRRRLSPELTPPSHSFLVSNFFFRFDRVTAEIKLMLYRVAQAPQRFPWPTDFENWQNEAHQALQALMKDIHSRLSNRKMRLNYLSSHKLLPMLELKYHHCVMLLFRPSPAIPKPTAESLAFCFNSASETLRLNYELLNFGQLLNTWLAAHTVFVSGITVLYCIWVSPSIREKQGQNISQIATWCSSLLDSLGKTWSVARDAKVKFDALARLTKESLAKQQEPQGELSARPEEQSFWTSTGPASDMAEENAGVLADVLGDMSEWFDLEWFDSGVASSPNES